VYGPVIVDQVAANDGGSWLSVARGSLPLERTQHCALSPPCNRLARASHPRPPARTSRSSPRTLAAQTREDGDPPLSVTNRERTLRFSLLFDGETVSYRVRSADAGRRGERGDRAVAARDRARQQDFRRNFELVGASPVTELSGVYRMVSGKQLEIRTRARAAGVHLPQRDRRSC
jgi:hypothetical protein